MTASVKCQTRRRCRPQAFVTSLPLLPNRRPSTAVSVVTAPPVASAVHSATSPISRVTVSLPTPLGVSLTEAVRDGQQRVIVTSVRPDGPASELVRVGDVVTTAAGSPAHSLTSVVAKIRDVAQQRDITLVLERSLDDPDHLQTFSNHPPHTDSPSQQEKPTSSAIYNDDAPSFGIYATQDAELSKLITSYTTNRKVSDLFAANDLKLLLETAEEIVRARARLSAKTVQLIFAVVYRLKRAAVPLSTKFYNVVMTNLIQCGHAAFAVDVFCDIESPTLECFTTLAKAYSRLNRPDDAIALIPVMRAHRIKPNVRTYNVLIASCVRVGQLKKARRLFSEMLVDEVQPNAVSWNIIINWYIQQNKGSRRLRGALDAFEDMKASGVSPDIVTFTTIMKAYARSGLLNKAEEVFEEMKRSMPSCVDATVYNTLLEAYASRLDWRRCGELFDEMIGEHVGTSSAYADDDILALASAFSDVRVPPHSRSFSRRRPWLEAEPSRHANSTEHPGVQPNVVSYCLVIKACAGAGRYMQAREMFDHMMEAGFLPPPSPAVVSLLNGYAKAGRLGDCFEVLKSLKTWGVFPDVRMLSTVMHGCLISDRAELALSVYSKLKAARLDADVITSTLLLRAYGALGDMEKMFNVVKRMQRRGEFEQPTVVTYNALIQCCLARGEITLALKALDMLLEARTQGVKVNSQTLEVLVFSVLPQLKVEDKSSLGTFDYLKSTNNENATENSAMSCSDAQKLTFLKNVLTALRNANAVPNGLVYRGLLMLCERLGEWRLASQLMDERANGLFIVSRRHMMFVRTLEGHLRTRLLEEQALQTV